TDVAAGAVASHTIIVSAVTLADITATGGVMGSTFAGGTQTIGASALPPAVTLDAYDYNNNYLGNNPTVCHLQQIEFDINPAFGEFTENKSFKWKLNGVTQLTQTGYSYSPPAISYINSALVNGDVVTLTIKWTGPASATCYSPDSITSMPIAFNVTANQPPLVFISSNILSDTMCVGNQAIITATALEAGTPNYKFFLDAVLVQNGPANTYTTSAALPIGSHLFRCDIISSEACDSQYPVFNPNATSPNIYVIVAQCTMTSVDDIDNSLPDLIYPNPATKQLTIDNVQLKISSIEIYDVLGQLVFSHQQTDNSQKQITIDVSKINSGIYFVKVKGENKELVVKFVKE
ncbi:MAG: T9SS type A sorting domain-containing protein, partial [Bacteroidia bacterium]|nr:T9SS type A sorting domain-containing protein [Bacteroidia bacterium]